MDIEACRDLVKASIKLDWVNRDICPKNFGTYDTHSTANMIKQFLPGLRNVYAGILIAVSITARIQYALGINADGLSSTGGGAA
jgi:hypothetical protein